VSATEASGHPWETDYVRRRCYEQSTPAYRRVSPQFFRLTPTAENGV